MYQILHLSHQYQSHTLQNLIIFTSQCCRDVPDYVPDMDFLHMRIMTMVELLKWLSHGSVYVNIIRKTNNSANNSSHGIPTKYRLDPCIHAKKSGAQQPTSGLPIGFFKTIL